MDENVEPEQKENRVGLFVSQLADIRRSNNRSLLETDKPACDTGHFIDIAQMGSTHPILKLVELSLEDLFIRLVIPKFKARMEVLEPSEREALYESLVSVHVQNIPDILLDKVPFTEDLYRIRENFIKEIFGSTSNLVPLLEAEIDQSYPLEQGILKYELNKDHNKALAKFYRLNICTNKKMSDALYDCYIQFKEEMIPQDTMLAMIKKLFEYGMQNEDLKPLLCNVIQHIASHELSDELAAYCQMQIHAVVMAAFNKTSIMYGMSDEFSIRCDQEKLKTILSQWLNAPQFKTSIFDSVSSIVGNYEKMVHAIQQDFDMKVRRVNKMLPRFEKEKEVAESFLNAIMDVNENLIVYEFAAVKKAILGFAQEFSIDSMTADTIHESETQERWKEFSNNHPVLANRSNEILERYISSNVSNRIRI
ncbi:MAG TPA: hypothetical protein VFP93_05415 [Gammaproteobacteria bacterium]|nr:hypothetical protein [Gammaproteobacteria bacterium]